MHVGKLSAEAESKIARWLEERPSIWRSLIDSCKARYYRRAYGRLLKRSLLWAVKLAAACSAPFLAYFVYGSIPLAAAIIASLYLIILYAVGSRLERWVSINAVGESPPEEQIWIRIGDLLASVRSEATLDGDREHSIQSTLGLIEGYARQRTRSPLGEISVSVVLYSNGDCTKMTVKHRNIGNKRPVKRVLNDLDRLLGHRVCSAKKVAPRVVNDLQSFGREIDVSPTQASTSYRSILFVPLKDAKSNKIKGFISIDCTTPYAFFGNDSDAIIVTCEPLISHIAELT